MARDGRSAGVQGGHLRLVVYEKPTCTTCRRLHDLLVSRGIDFDTVDYHVEGLTEDEIRDLLRRAGVGPREVLRRREPRAADYADASDEGLISAMAAHPELLQRPIAVRGERAVLARPVERVLELL